MPTAIGDNLVQFDPARRRRPGRRSASSYGVPRGADLGAVLESWRLSLEASAKSPRTVRGYTDTAVRFLTYLADNGLPTDAEGVQAEHVRAFLVFERHRTSAVSADVAFRCLRVWFNWMREEGERTQPSPVLKADRPQTTRKVRRFLSDDDIRALLKVCSGNDFEARRDTAIVRIFADNGARVSGLAGVRYTPRDERTNDVDLRGRRLRIRLKGGDEHWIPLGAKAAQALDRYLRARSAHPKAHSSPWLWLGIQGRGTEHMTSSGMYQMLKRRGEEAGVENVHPHRFRGTAAHNLLKAGASDGDVQHILGWKTRDMVDHYTGDLAQERARETHARLSPGDRI
ncbi:tyrosine-type recombinase/integrase [Microbispora sp. NPDC049633]|uniref:tyrosine-type recombinase/integrase n=1 Tax=Microbispora sp. NPDC049633 TaxID=3154355 RepID=UPI0034136450